ncbi:hypothetical protein EDB83DRAFT_2533363 [Lactarius deliciosus]|nr:hypothetical protein EDB83DRAFT_2533363 [Lactarius deliciosus]
MSAESALTHAEVDYRKGNIDSKIRQHLTAPSQEHSDESFARFIMAIDLDSLQAPFEQAGSLLLNVQALRNLCPRTTPVTEVAGAEGGPVTSRAAVELEQGE